MIFPLGDFSVLKYWRCPSAQDDFRNKASVMFCVKNHGCIANFYIHQPLFFEVSQQNPHFSKLLWTFPMKHEFCSPGLMGWWVSVGLSWFMGWKKLKNWLDHNMYPLGMTNSSPWYRWPMEIDGLPINSMVDLSMAMLNNQMVYTDED